MDHDIWRIKASELRHYTSSINARLTMTQYNKRDKIAGDDRSYRALFEASAKVTKTKATLRLITAALAVVERCERVAAGLPLTRDDIQAHYNTDGLKLIVNNT